MTTDLVQYVAICLVECPNEASLRHLSELCGAVECNILELFCEDILTAVRKYAQAGSGPRVISK